MSDPVSRLNAALEGRYAIERELGEGGMATVYLADDLKHKRKVALKVLKPELAAVVGAERFLAEITTTANLTHPHILPLFDSGEAENRVGLSGLGLESVLHDEHDRCPSIQRTESADTPNGQKNTLLRRALHR